MTTLRAMIELKCALKDLYRSVIKTLKIDKLCYWLEMKIRRLER